MGSSSQPQASGSSVGRCASRIERSDNLYLSTLADYVDALGGHLEINAVFDDNVVSLGPVGKEPGEVPA